MRAVPSKTTPKTGRPRLYQTASERQAAYRQRARAGKGGIALTASDPGQGARRVDLWLPTEVALALRRLARHKGVSQARILADLVGRADRQARAKMDDAAFAEYVTG